MRLVAQAFVVNSWLKPHLPQRLDVVSGEVIDSSDRTSGQTDTILRDNQFLAWGIGGQSLVPVEATPGCIEVKNSLAGNELEIALKKVARIKSLTHVQHRGMYMACDDARVDVPPTRTKVYIIAYDGPRWPTIRKKLEANPQWCNGDYLNYGLEVLTILGRGGAYKNDSEVFFGAS